MIKYTKPPIKRLQVLHLRLRDNNYPNTVNLSQELEVSRRTVLRDIEYLRDQMGAPIDYDQIKKGFYYTDKTYTFPYVQITEGELIAIFVAEKVLSQYQGTPYEDALKNAFQRITSSLPEKVSINLSGIEQAYSFKMPAATVQDVDIFKKLSGATIKKRQINIKYYTLNRDNLNSRIIDPYHLVNTNGDWYLFAYCHNRNEIRTFLVARIKDIEETGKTFDVDKNFEPSLHFGLSFGIYTGEGKHTIRLRFDELAARYIKEKVWHQSQIIKENKDNSIILTLRLNSLVEIKWWILSWGEYVEVLSPVELRQSVADTASLCAKMYKRKNISHK